MRDLKVHAATCLGAMALLGVVQSAAADRSGPASVQPAERRAGYIHGFDPYDGRLDARRHSSASSPSGYAYYPSPLPAQRSDAWPVYGYEAPERPGISPFEQRDWQYGYFYDRSGDLEYGWYYEPLASSDRIITPHERWPQERSGRRPGTGSAREMPGPPEGRIERFSGTVEETVTATDRTSNTVHLIARVREPDGVYRAVALGRLATTDIREGDWIEGFGIPGTIQGQPVILASRVSSGGDTQVIRENTGRPARNYRGELISVRYRRLAGLRGIHMIAELLAGTGTVQTIVLGPMDSTPPLEVGDMMTVWARPVMLDGLPALVAEQLAADGRTFNVHYSRDLSEFETR